VKCEEPLKPSKKGFGHGHGLRNLGDDDYDQNNKKESIKSKYSHKKQTPTPAPFVPILPVCHKVPIVIPKTCTRQVTAEATPYCRVGKYKGGSICEELEVIPPTLKCDATEDEQGCYILERSKPLRACPPGYSQGHDGECTKIEIADFIFFCPPNTEGPQCATYFEKICPHGGCEKVIFDKATPICPEWYVLTEREKGKDICVKETFVDKVEVCPKNAERANLSCVFFELPIVRKGIRELPPNVVCPPRYKDSGSHCTREEFAPAQPVCPDHARFDGVKCVAIVPKNRICPKGSVFEKNKCWVINKAEALTVDTVIEKPHKKHPPPPPPHKKGGW